MLVDMTSMAIVMGTALVLNEMQLTPDRRLKILFQPAEEKLLEVH